MSNPSEELYQRAWSLDVAGLQALLSHGADPNFAPDGAGDSSFLRVVRRVSDEGLALLLAHGANPCASDLADGRTALHVLAMESVRDVSPQIARLLAAGADVHARDGDGWTPLDRAAMFSPLAALTTLLDHGAKPEAHWLLEQIVRRPDGLALLLARGAPAVPGPADTNSALHAAVLHQQPVSMTRLLDAGAPVDWRTPAKGHSPLRLAVAQRDAAAVQLLLAHGADPGLPDHIGVSPLDVATHMAEATLVGLMAEHAGGVADRDRALADLAVRAQALRQRQEALLDRIAHEGHRFRLITPGYKYEYDDTQRVWYEGDTWKVGAHDGYSQRQTVRDTTRDDALAAMYNLCANREDSPEQTFERIAACVTPG